MAKLLRLESHDDHKAILIFRDFLYIRALFPKEVDERSVIIADKGNEHFMEPAECP